MSYRRGYQKDHNSREGYGYHTRNGNDINQRYNRQHDTSFNATKRVSNSQDNSGVRSNTNAGMNGSLIEESNHTPNASELVKPQAETLSAEEKRKLRQAKLAKWKQKQATPESSTPSAPEKKLFVAKLKKPLIAKKVQPRASVPSANNHLFGEEAEEASSGAPKSKKAKISNGNGEHREEVEDPLEQFMVDIGKNETKEAHSSEILDNDSENEDQNHDGSPESVADLLNKSNSIHKAKDVPYFAPSSRTITKKFYDFSMNSLKSEDIHEISTVNEITIKPDDALIRPIKEFGQLGLTSKMVETLNDLNFSEPTPIQKIALPVLMAGHDLIAVAKTGSGKTLAFVLPMIRHIVANVTGLSKSNQTPIGLILTPTRELALQIYKDCKPFLKQLNLRGVCCYGGSNISAQIAELKRGAELVVCTPGRLIDLLTANNGRVTNLSEVSFLVLDEADRMFDLGFEPQIMKIIKNIRPDRQTCLFSATFAKKIEMLATKVLIDPTQIIVGGGRSVVSDTITQRVMVVKPNDKFFKLLKILGDYITEQNRDKRVLIFCSTQDRCDNLLAQILQRGYKGLSIHGGKDQVDRDGAINDFQKGLVSILVATSIAARGLDVKDLEIVVNYDAPNHMEDYVHRVGRTGRAGKTGIAYTFVEPTEERAGNDIAKALKMSKNIVPDDINELATKFQEKLKDGKEKFSSGFGGKGLEKLDEARQKTKNLERRTHGVEETEEKPAHPAATPESNAVEEKEFSGIEFTVVDGPVPGKLDSRAFHSKIYINDLPQKVRVLLSQQYPVIVEQTNVSITTKGTFITDDNSKDEKLHILLESDEKMDVISAVSMVKSTVIEGLKESNEEELRRMKQGGSGKYTI